MALERTERRRCRDLAADGTARRRRRDLAAVRMRWWWDLALWGGGGEGRLRHVGLHRELVRPPPPREWKKRLTLLASGKPVDPTCILGFSRAYTSEHRATK
jgi:hypothetical protein